MKAEQIVIRTEFWPHRLNVIYGGEIYWARDGGAVRLELHDDAKTMYLSASEAEELGRALIEAAKVTAELDEPAPAW